MPITYLYRRLCSLATLHLAWLHVEEADGCAGVDNVTVASFARDTERQLRQLSEELSRNEYQPLPLLRFFVPKIHGGQRSLSVPAVRDRVVQSGVVNVIEPIFEKEFESCSFAYRKGHSVKQAIQQIEFLHETGYQWVLDADITSYFDNVDHGLMMSRVEELILDKKINNLLRQWIAARIYDGHQISSMLKGLPQGSPISPLLANLYLDTFDDQMLSSGQKLVRFADDFLVLCKTKPHAERALRLSRQFLSNLRLTLSEEKTSITNFTDGFKYLGVTFVGGMTLTAARGRLLEQSPLNVPPPLPVLRAAPFRSKAFNPAIRNALLGAFEDVAAEQIPSFFQRPRERCELDKASASIAIHAGSSDTIEGPPAPAAEPITPNRTGVIRDKSGGGGNTNHEIGRVKAQMFNKPRLGPPPSAVALRTLYIHEHGAIIRCEDEHLRVLKDDIEVLSLPAFKIDQIILFGNSQVTTGAMKFCLRHDIPIFVLNGMGRFYGAIESTGNQRVLLQQKQFERLADEKFVLDTARQIVSGKIWNCRTLLQRRLRSKPQPTGGSEPRAVGTTNADALDQSMPSQTSLTAPSSLSDDGTQLSPILTQDNPQVETTKVQKQSSMRESLVVNLQPQILNRLAQSINDLQILSSALSKAKTLDEIRGHALLKRDNLKL